MIIWTTKREYLSWFDMIIGCCSDANNPVTLFLNLIFSYCGKLGILLKDDFFLFFSFHAHGTYNCAASPMLPISEGLQGKKIRMFCQQTKICQYRNLKDCRYEKTSTGTGKALEQAAER